MTQRISQRLAEIVEALPLRENMHVLEIGCGTGVLAREIVSRLSNISVLGIDRSAKAIQQASKNCATAIAKGKIRFIQAAIENFEAEEASKRFDLAFAIRVGALDGRHPNKEAAALKNIAKMLEPGGKLYLDGGSPLKEVNIDPYR